MKKALIAIFLCVGFIGCGNANAEDVKPSYNVASEACVSGKSLSYTIVRIRDSGVSLKDMVSTIAATPAVDSDDSTDGAMLAKSMAIDTAKDAYANLKLDKDAIAYRAYDRCMHHFGYSGTL